MSIVYGLRRMVFGSARIVPIDKSEFLCIKGAISGLNQFVFLEQKFDYVIENYLEFEKHLLSVTADQMILSGHDVNWFHTQRDVFNRRIMNLLSTGKTYIDTTPQHVANLFGRNSAEVDSTSSIFSESYDNRLGYRAMSAMRNFVQHRGLPVHGSNYTAAWVDKKVGRSLLYTVDPYLHPQELRDGGKFKASVLTELENIGKKIDLKLLVRDYIEGLAEAHTKIHLLLDSKRSELEMIFDTAVSRYQESTPTEDSIIGLAAIAQDIHGNVIEEVPLVRTLIEYRQSLERKNSGLVNLSKRYVTNEIAQHT